MDSYLFPLYGSPARPKNPAHPCLCAIADGATSYTIGFNGGPAKNGDSLSVHTVQYGKAEYTDVDTSGGAM